MKTIVLSDLTASRKPKETRYGLFGSVNDAAEVQKKVDQYTAQYLDTIVDLDSAKKNLKDATDYVHELEAEADSAPRSRMKRALHIVIPKIQDKVNVMQAAADLAAAQSKAAADALAAATAAQAAAAAQQAAAIAAVHPDPLGTLTTPAASGTPSSSDNLASGGSASATDAGTSTPAPVGVQQAAATTQGFLQTHKTLLLVGAGLVVAAVVVYKLKGKS